jgi:hypothetical protein
MFFEDGLKFDDEGRGKTNESERGGEIRLADTPGKQPNPKIEGLQLDING